jgi:hypothetical protein
VTTTPELQKQLVNGRQRVTIQRPLPPHPDFPPVVIPDGLKAEVKKVQEEAEKLKDDPKKAAAFVMTWYESDAGKRYKAIFEEHYKNVPSVEEQREWQKKNREVTQNAIQAVIEKDGSFRAEDVPAGDWVLRVDLYGEDFQNLGAAEPQDFTIPEMPSGRSDEPFDLGTVKVK